MLQRLAGRRGRRNTEAEAKATPRPKRSQSPWTDNFCLEFNLENFMDRFKTELLIKSIDVFAVFIHGQLNRFAILLTTPPDSPINHLLNNF